jgi:hypothetical protein
MGSMTPEAKLALHKMIYYQMITWTTLHPMRCYAIARDKANYCLAALGERLEDEN